VKKEDPSTSNEKKEETKEELVKPNVNNDDTPVTLVTEVRSNSKLPF
jgi:hypothetical protein